MPKKTYVEFKKELIEKMNTYYTLKEKYNNNELKPEQVRELFECSYMFTNAFSKLVENSSKTIPDDEKLDFYLQNSDDAGKKTIYAGIIQMSADSSESTILQNVPNAKEYKEKISENVFYSKTNEAEKK